MIYNTLQWTENFKKGHTRKIIWMKQGKVHYTYSTWNVRLGKWGGEKGKWTQIVLSTPHFMVLTF